MYRSLMLVIGAGLASCSGQETAQPNSSAVSAPSPAELAKAELAARDKELSEASTSLQNEFVAAANSAKSFAEDHALRVQSRMLDDQSVILAKSEFYARTGGAGLSARFSREEAMRDRAVRGLQQSKGILEAGLSINNRQVELLQAIKTKAGADRLAGIVLTGQSDFVQLEKAVKAAGGTIENSDAIRAARTGFNKAIKAYNGAAKALSMPLVKEAPQPASEVIEAGMKKASQEAALEKSQVAEAAEAEPRFSASEQQEIAEWQKLNSSCRGGTVPADELDAVCAQRDQQVSKMAESGLCYGKRTDEASAYHRWHFCTEESYR